MSDRELLELAAKAAGYEWTGYFGDDEVECQYFDIGLGEEVVPWNPLTDYRDALRLAVAIGAHEGKCQVLINIDEVDSLGPTRAICLAIVRAAAEIGRNMP
jgi:hypothetical protein